MVFDKAGSSFHLVLVYLTGSAGSEPCVESMCRARFQAGVNCCYVFSFCVDVPLLKILSRLAREFVLFTVPRRSQSVSDSDFCC